MKRTLQSFLFALVAMMSIEVGVHAEVVCGNCEAIDLGLPSGLKWASCNIGAFQPEESGGYYAWGEIEEKNDYSFDNYKWSFDSKYSRETKRILDLEDDVARVTMGDDWRIPTMENVQELVDVCVWEWTRLNEVNGHRVIGPNGNSIFLPAAGAYLGENLVTDFGYGGYYQTSTLGGYGPLGYENEQNGDYSQYLYFYREQYKIWCDSRYVGKTVRPICGTPITYKVKVSSEGGGSVAIEGNTETSIVAVNGMNMTVIATPNVGYRFIGWFLDGVENPIRTSVTYTFAVSEDVSLVAKFEEVTIVEDDRAIDLGLPSGIKWALCNIGADNPEDFGGYYAWGEIEEKEVYSWDTYKWGNGDANFMIKYCTDETYGVIDHNSTLDEEDDVAHVKWGGEWRIPTWEEFNELFKQCVWTRETIGGVGGFKVVGPNGNSIFMPAGGYYSGEGNYNAGSEGFYWSSTLFGGDNNKAGFLGWNSAGVVCYYYSRHLGKPVRPVCGTPIMCTVSVFSDDKGCVEISGKKESYANVLKGSSVTVKATPSSGYEFQGWYIDGERQPRSTEATYSFAVDENVDLTAKFYESTIISETVAIDLGLPSGLKWATCNVGASVPEEMGGFYAWGETEKKDCYNKDNYEWYDSNASIYKKYCVSGGFADGKTILDPEDDVAHVKWGGEWYTPTVDEVQELIDCCTWEWITLNGKEGYQVTGPNGNNIFLPATGIYMDEVLVTDLGTSGYYHTCNLGGYNGSLDSNSEYSQRLSFAYAGGATTLMSYYHFRFWGQSVRPVCRDNIRVSSVSLDCSEKELFVGDSFTLVATTTPENQSVKWTSSNLTVAIVDDNGLVTAIAPGTATIIATANDGIGVNASCEVTVVRPEHIVISIGEYSSATYSSEYALDFSEVDGLKAYVAAGYNSFTGIVTLLRVKTTQAGIGLFVKGEPGTYEVPIMEVSADNMLNMLVATLEETSVDAYSNDGHYANYKYTILPGDEEPFFHQFEDGSTLGGGKSYLQIPVEWIPATEARTIKFRFDDGSTTDIEEMEIQQSKLIFDLMGRRVMSPHKRTLYIIGGKKVIY